MDDDLIRERIDSTSKMSLFSVIIPTFNRVTLLSSILASVFSQRFTDFEIIVVDDGSTDGTRDFLRSLGERVKIFRLPNHGAGAARNLGAQHARGTYLAFLDSDDLWFPWTLDVYRGVINEHGHPSFVAGKPHRFSEEKELGRAVFGKVRTEWFVDYLASGEEWRWWGASSFVVRRDVFAAVGGFTDAQVNGEDADLALRLGTAPDFVQITSPVTFAYREHASSAVWDLKRTYEGACFMVGAEQTGQYPGGRARAFERRRILTRHTRPVVLGCLHEGLRREAWTLYRATFAWNAALGRGRYLAAFPALAALAAYTRGVKCRADCEKKIGRYAMPVRRTNASAGYWDFFKTITHALKRILH
jgi:Glycosyl transferase family 2